MAPAAAGTLIAGQPHARDPATQETVAPCTGRRHRHRHAARARRPGTFAHRGPLGPRSDAPVGKPSYASVSSSARDVRRRGVRRARQILVPASRRGDSGWSLPRRRARRWARSSEPRRSSRSNGTRLPACHCPKAGARERRGRGSGSRSGTGEGTTLSPRSSLCVALLGPDERDCFRPASIAARARSNGAGDPRETVKPALPAPMCLS